MPLTGKQSGSLGWGRLAKRLPRRCHLRASRMDVKYFSRSAKSVAIPADETHYDLKRWLAAVDVVSSRYWWDEHQHLINADVLAAMQPHAYLINTHGNIGWTDPP